MTVKELLAGGGGAFLLIMTLIQIAPIKLNPWSAIAGAIGRAINKEVLASISEVRHDQRKTQQALDDHIKVDNTRNADAHRARILQFNNELLRNIPHTREDFIEILAEIDFYERFCEEHKEYKNNRCVHAVANISRVYDERLAKHDFL